MPLPAILGGLGGASLIAGLFQQRSQQREADRLRNEAIAQFEAIGPMIQEFARGRDLDVGDERAVQALVRQLSRTDRSLLAQLRERGVTGGALTQAQADVSRRTGERSGELEAQLAATNPTRRAQRQHVMTQFMQQLAQLRNAQSNAAANAPNPFLQLANTAGSAAFGAATIDSLQQSRGGQLGRTGFGGGGPLQELLELLRQTSGQASGRPAPSDGRLPNTTLPPAGRTAA